MYAGDRRPLNIFETFFSVYDDDHNANSNGPIFETAPFSKFYRQIPRRAPLFLRTTTKNMSTEIPMTESTHEEARVQIVNDEKPSSTPSAANQNQQFNVPVTNDTPAFEQTVYLVDLDNVGNTLGEIAKDARPESDMLYIFYGPKPPRVEIQTVQKLVPYIRHERCFFFPTMSKQQNAADFCLAFTAGVLCRDHDGKPVKPNIVIVSDDNGFQVVAEKIRQSGYNVTIRNTVHRVNESTATTGNDDRFHWQKEYTSSSTRKPKPFEHMDDNDDTDWILPVLKTLRRFSDRLPNDSRRLTNFIANNCGLTDNDYDEAQEIMDILFELGVISRDDRGREDRRNRLQFHHDILNALCDKSSIRCNSGTNTISSSFSSMGGSKENSRRRHVPDSNKYRESYRTAASRVITTQDRLPVFTQHNDAFLPSYMKSGTKIHTELK